MPLAGPLPFFLARMTLSMRRRAFIPVLGPGSLAARGRGDCTPPLARDGLGSLVTLVTDARPLVWHQFRSQLASFAGPRRKLPWHKSKINSSDLKIECR